VPLGGFEWSDGTTWQPLLPTLVAQPTPWGPGTGYSLIVRSASPAVTANTIWIKPTA
jgi:hypothetical protein